MRGRLLAASVLVVASGCGTAVEPDPGLEALALSSVAPGTVIPGTKNAERVRQNAQLMKEPIPAAFWEELKSEGVLPAAAPTPAG